SLIQEDPVYGSIGAEDKKRQYKWGAHKLFNCRRVQTDPRFWSPFSREEQASLLVAVKKTSDGLRGSHGDLIIKAAFGALFSQSGVADKFLKVFRSQTLEGFVAGHPFGRKQHGTTRPTYTKVMGWKCTQGDIHAGGDFLECCGTQYEEKAL